MNSQTIFPRGASTIRSALLGKAGISAIALGMIALPGAAHAAGERDFTITTGSGTCSLSAGGANGFNDNCSIGVNTFYIDETMTDRFNFYSDVGEANITIQIENGSEIVSYTDYSSFSLTSQTKYQIVGSSGSYIDLDITTKNNPAPAAGLSFNNAQSGPFTANISFTEPVTGLDINDFTAINATLSNFAGSGANYSILVTPTAAGSGRLSLAANAAQDAYGAGNNGVMANFTYTPPDTTPPTFAWSGDTVVAYGGTANVTLTFSENVTGVEFSDFVVNNGTLQSVSGSGSVYTLAVTPAFGGNINIELKSNSVADGAGNQNAAGATHTVVVDGTSPSATVSTAVANTNLGPIDFSVVFSEDIVWLGGTPDPAVTNGTVQSYSGSGSSYTFTVQPTAEGTVSFSVPANKAKDAAGNGNITSNTASASYDITGPTATLTQTGGSRAVSGQFTVDVVFNEDVTGISSGDFNVAGGVATVSGSGANYVLTVTPSGSSDLAIQLSPSIAYDLAGNENDASAILNVTYDGVAPGAQIGALPASVNGAFTANITFTESVTGLTVSDLSAGNASLSGLAGSGTSYSVLVTPTSDGVVTLDLAAGAATDEAGNSNTAAAQVSTNYDGTAPSISFSGPAGQQNGQFTVNITASEVITGLDISDLSAGNATLSNLTGSGTSYSVTVTPTADGAVTLDLPALAATDAAGNGNTAAGQFSTSYDGTAPTVSFTGPGSIQTGPFTVAIDFSEAVTGFTISDLVAGNATLSGFAGSGANYTVQVTPAGDGTVTLDLAAAAATDAGGNGNNAASQFAVNFDGTAPTATFSGPSGVQSSPFTVSIDFSEAVTGFTVSDLVAGNATLSGFTGSGSSYSVTVTPSGDGQVTLDLAAGAATDVAGLANTAATQFSVEHDATLPSVTITGPSTIQTGTFTATISFSEPVTGFVIGDIIAGNASLSAFTGSGADYTVLVTPAADGQVTLDVAAGVAGDTAGNTNAAASTFSVEFDNTAPTATITGPAGIQTGPFDVAIAFSEVVTGLVASDFNVTGATATLTGSGSDYVLTITPDGSAAIEVSLPAGSAQDAAGTPNSASNSLQFTYDNAGPAVSITGIPALSNAPFEATVTFTETVTGFTIDDIAATNATLSQFAGSGASYTVLVTPTADGQVTLGIAAGVAIDGASNPNGAASDVSAMFDATAPAIQLAGPSEPQTGEFDVTVSFTEVVSGLTADKFEIANATGILTGTGADYVLTITPAGNGNITILLPEAAVLDAAGNANTASSLLEMGQDATAPTVSLSSPSNLVKEAFTATIEFDEVVTGFTIDDILAGNANLSNFSGSGSSYTVVVTPVSDGTVTLDIAADVAVDGAGLANAAATTLTVVHDSTAPSVTLSSDSDAQSDAFEVSVSFSEVVTGLDVSDFTVTNADIALAGTGSEYVLTVTPNGAGDMTVALRAGAALDQVGLESTASNTLAITYDVEVPTLQITGVPAQATRAFDAQFTFSEPVTGFNEEAVVAENATVSNAAGSGTSYSVTVTPTGTGDIVLSLAEGKVRDSAGNFIGGTQTSVVVVYDSERPTVSFSELPSRIDGPFELTVTFSEDVTGFEAKDLLLVNMEVLSIEEQDAATYVVTLNPLEQGTVSVGVAAMAVRDAAGNPNIVSQVLTGYYIDKEAIRFRTSAVLTNFMARRADQIVAAEPDLEGRLGQTGSSGSIKVAYNGSLNGLLDASSQFGKIDSNPIGAWLSGSYTEVDATDSDSRLWIGHAGIDVGVTENLVAGVMVQYDNAKENGDGFTIEGEGYLVGPYAVARIGSGVTISARAAWGDSDNEVSPYGTYTDSVDADRSLYRIGVSGKAEVTENWTLRPEASFTRFRETSDAYLDSQGVVIPDLGVAIDRLTFGPKVEYRLPLESDVVLTPFAGIKGVWDLKEVSTYDVLDPTGGAEENFRARVSGGFNASKGAATGNLEAFFDGIGAESFDAYGARLTVSFGF